MARLVQTGGRIQRKQAIPIPLLPMVATALLAVFVLAPWPLAHKAHALLHGLCAQRPSHSFALGGTLLPFDARMTGIYGGFATTALWLLLKGRLSAWRLPPRPVVLVLAAFVAALAVDGGNALLLDIGAAPLYPPDNRLRVATGALTGIALAVSVCHVLATALWRSGDRQTATVRGPGEVAMLALVQVPLVAVALSGWGVLYAPLTLLLVCSATVVVGSLTLACLTMLRLRDGTYGSAADLQGAAALSLVVGLVVMGVIAGARFWAERAFGIVPLT